MHSQTAPYSIRRALSRNAYSLGMVATVAIVIGAAICVFVAFYGVLLRQYPLPDSGRLVMLWESDRDTDARHSRVTESAYPIYRSQLVGFEALAGFVVCPPTLPVKRIDTDERVTLANVTPSLFPMIRAVPRLGRTFTEPEGQRGGDDVAILSYGFWQRGFGGRSDVLGQRLHLNEFGNRNSYTIVGVMPQEVTFPFPLSADRPDVWIPYHESRGRFLPGQNLNVIGKLRTGSDVAAVQAELDRLASRIGRDHPRYYGSISITAVPLTAESLRDVKGVVVALVAAFLLVASTGCANLLHLALARAAAREREVAIRLALGATRPALFRLVVFETGFLVALGGAVGFGFAALGVKALPLVLPPRLNIPGPAEVMTTLPVVLFACASAAAATLGLATIICLRLAKRDVRQALAGIGTTSPKGRPIFRRSGSVLMACQVAFAFALTCAACAALQDLRHLLNKGAQIDPDRLLALDVAFAPGLEGDSSADYEVFLARAKRLPAVKSVALVDRFPLTTVQGLFSAARREGALFDKEQPAEFHVVSRGYADVLGLRAIEGRWFSDTDAANTRGVAVINEAMARRYFPTTSPIGVRLKGGTMQNPNWPRDWEVVGVVREPERAGMDRETPPAVYVPWEQARLSLLTVLVRTTASARKTARLLRDETLGIRRGTVEVRRMQTGTDMVSEVSARARFVSDQLGVLGLLALLVASVGIYSIVSFQTSRRRREIAIRMAVGSTSAGVFRVVVAETVGQVAFGIAVGVPLAWGVLRAMGSLRPELTPAAGVPYVATVLLCLCLAVVGAAPAAWRAASTDPVRVLYTE